MSKYKIIMTGGGTAGHVTPNLALIPNLKEKDFEIKYIGSPDGIEKEIIKRENIPYFEISSGKLRRYFDVKNFTDPFKVMKGVAQAFKIMGKEKPDVVFSKGGFVAVPVVIAASMKKIPVIAHESDITPGLANKLSSPFCDKLCVTFKESLKYIKENKGVHTGSPIRKEIFEGSKDKGKRLCGFNDNKEVILIMGGSLGSKVINDEIRNNINEITKNYNLIHICGKGNIDNTLTKNKSYKQFEYVNDELPDLMALCDYVISRAGANSIFEFLALNKPMLLIPLSKRASRGDQILNANSFKKDNCAIVVEEEELQSGVLLEKIKKMREEKKVLIKSMKESNAKEGNSKIVDLIIESVKK